jgi:hypothetical protein
MAMDIRADDLRRPEVLQLLREHLDSLAQLSAPESVHALGLEGLRQPVGCMRASVFANARRSPTTWTIPTACS